MELLLKFKSLLLKGDPRGLDLHRAGGGGVVVHADDCAPIMDVRSPETTVEDHCGNGRMLHARAIACAHRLPRGKRVVELLESKDTVGSYQYGVGLHESTVVIDPRSILTL